MKEVNPSLYNSFVDKYTKRPSFPDSDGMYFNEDIDSLLAHSKPSVWKSGKDNLSWYCPIDQTADISSPHYNLSKDFIKVPLKNQYKTSDSKEGVFADGQEFYATLLQVPKVVLIVILVALSVIKSMQKRNLLLNCQQL